MANLKVHTLPEELVLPFIASWRTMEKSLNPVFTMILRCSSCGKLSDNHQEQGPAFVVSKKKKHGMPVIIGIQCQTEDCDMVVKFQEPISPGDDNFPQRLKKFPKTALSDSNGKPGVINQAGLEEIKTILDLE